MLNTGKAGERGTVVIQVKDPPPPRVIVHHGISNGSSLFGQLLIFPAAKFQLIVIQVKLQHHNCIQASL